MSQTTHEVDPAEVEGEEETLAPSEEPTGPAAPAPDADLTGEPLKEEE